MLLLNVKSTVNAPDEIAPEPEPSESTSTEIEEGSETTAGTDDTDEN